MCSSLEEVLEFEDIELSEAVAFSCVLSVALLLPLWQILGSPHEAPLTVA